MLDLDLSNRISDAAGERAPALLGLLEDMVATNSGSYSPGGAASVLATLVPHFEALGFSASWQERAHPETGETYHHVLLSRPAAPSPFSVLHLGHADTVFGPEHHFQSLAKAGDRWSGPGVADMKGGLAAILGVQQVLSDVGLLPSLDSSVLLNSDEEIQSRTSRALIEEAARGRDLVLVYEPARESRGVIVARKGVARYRVAVHGRAAHSGNQHEDGRSAILAAAHLVVGLESLTDRERGVTVNVGLIQGGTSRNTVPACCELEVDARSTTPEDGASLDAAVRRLCESTTVPDTRVEIEGGIGRPAWRRDARAVPAVEAFAAAGDLLGSSVPPIEVGGGSDGNFAAALGIPTLDGLGPVGGALHTDKEWMEPSTMADRIALCACALATLAGS